MKLDRVQKNIVESNASKICVIAGAGSGKTTVLTERVRHLLNKGVEPESIVAITFTNSATEEMKERLSDVNGAERMFIGTIHSYANRLLHRSGQHYEILTDEMYDKLFREMIKECCEFLTEEKYKGYTAIQKAVKAGRKKKYEADDYLNCKEQYEYDVIAGKKKDFDCPDNVFTLAKSRGIITFDEIIDKAHGVLSQYRIKYLLVDEYQDIGYREDKFIRSLNAENIFIVGDDWQSIYGFKGADLSIFSNYALSDEWQVYRLENNYRSAKEIISFAERIVDDFPHIAKKVIVKSKNSRGKVVAEPKTNLSKYLSLVKEQDNYAEWFILTRSNKDLSFIMGECQKYGLPCMTFRKAEMTAKELKQANTANKVKVLTVHSAKGLEAQNVILYGNSFGFRCYFHYYDEARLESEYEERRIFYVGATRAKKQLIVLNNDK